MASADEEPLLFETQGTIAIITINREKKLGALSGELYYELAQLLQKIALMDNIYITVLTGKGRYYSAYVIIYRNSDTNCV
jgi:peroxisomal 3,2-trans-enoyl-CoA isomerase